MVGRPRPHTRRRPRPHRDRQCAATGVPDATLLLSPPQQFLDAAANGARVVLVVGLWLAGPPPRQARAGGDTAQASLSQRRPRHQRALACDGTDEALPPPGPGFGRTRRRERGDRRAPSLMTRAPHGAAPERRLLRLWLDGAHSRRGGAQRRGRPWLHSPRHPGTAAAATEGGSRQVLQSRHIAGLDVVEDGLEGAARHAPTIRAARRR